MRDKQKIELSVKVGGEVKDIRIEGDMAIITFETTETDLWQDSVYLWLENKVKDVLDSCVIRIKNNKFGKKTNY